jgi:hypothetical protein
MTSPARSIEAADDSHAAIVELLTDLETDDRACRIKCLENLEGPAVALALARLRRQRPASTDQTQED